MARSVYKMKRPLIFSRVSGFKNIGYWNRMSVLASLGQAKPLSAKSNCALGLPGAAGFNGVARNVSLFGLRANAIHATLAISIITNLQNISEKYEFYSEICDCFDIFHACGRNIIVGQHSADNCCEPYRAIVYFRGRSFPSADVFHLRDKGCPKQ